MYMNAKKSFVLFGIILFSCELGDARNTPRNGFDAYNNYEIYDNYDYDTELECKPSILPPDPKSMCCGVDVSFSNRIVGGSPTLPYQYPWLALIEYRNYDGYFSARCGGSLISSLYVLTAAHCVAGTILEESTPHNVLLGAYDRNQNGPVCVIIDGIKRCSKTEIRIGIEQYIHHEFFQENENINDIGLIKLEKTAPYTDFIRPICLPTFDLSNTYHTNIWLTAAGWGTVNQFLKGNEEIINIPSNVKRHVRLPYVPYEYCQKVWYKYDINTNKICAGGEKYKNACNGDSGGPLMFNNDGQFEVTGVVSFGSLLCGRENVPGIYVNVYKYKNWIMNVIQGRW